MDLQTICNVIILISATCLAIKNIAEWFGRPIVLFRKRSDRVLKEKIKEVLEETLPDILLEHDKETRLKYLSDREAYLKEITKEVLNNIQGELCEVATLSEQYKILTLSAKDVLREKIMQIYFKNRRDRALSYHEKEALTQYYKDYKAMKGNSYIDRYYNRMSTWTVADDDYDEE